MRSTRTLPPPLAPSIPGSFAQRTLRERLPRILAEVAESPEVPPAARARLRRGCDRLPELTVERLALPPDDAPAWEPFFLQHAGRRLAGLPFFELEAYFYAWVLAETGYFETGVDPFAATKREEYAASAASLEAASQATLEDEARPPRQAARRALLRAVLGNHADASNPQVLRAGAGALELVQEEPWGGVEQLLFGGPRLTLLADNAMSELWYDLALARSLVRAAPGLEVEIVLKRHPMFVSDAVPGDVEALWELTDAEAAGSSLRRLSRDVRETIAKGRIAIRSFPELNAPLHLSAPAFAPLLAHGAPLVLKGDANYRRALEDRDWPPAAPLERACRMPVRQALFLRVLKSECVAGLPAALVRRLARADPDWRTDGRFATVQLLRRRTRS